MTESPTPAQELALKIVISITSCMSSVGCFYILYKVVKLKQLNNMIVMMTIGDLIATLSLGIPVMAYWTENFAMLGVYDQSAQCQIQAFFEQLGIQLSLFWSLNIAFSVYYSIMPVTRNLTKQIIIIGFIIPIFLSCLPLMLQAYGQSEVIYINGTFECLNTSICYIQSSTYFIRGKIAFFLAYQIPVVYVLFNIRSVFICNTYLFIKIARMINAHLSSGASFCVLFQLLMYPLIMMGCNISFVMFKSIIYFKPVGWYNFRIWCYFSVNLMGFFDSMAYGFVLQRKQNSIDSEKQGYISMRTINT